MAIPPSAFDAKKRELVGNFKNPGRKWDHCPFQLGNNSCARYLVNFQKPKADWRRIAYGYENIEPGEMVRAPAAD